MCATLFANYSKGLEKINLGHDPDAVTCHCVTSGKLLSKHQKEGGEEANLYPVGGLHTELRGSAGPLATV